MVDSPGAGGRKTKRVLQSHPTPLLSAHTLNHVAVRVSLHHEEENDRDGQRAQPQEGEVACQRSLVPPRPNGGEGIEHAQSIKRKSNVVHFLGKEKPSSQHIDQQGCKNRAVHECVNGVAGVVTADFVLSVFDAHVNSPRLSTSEKFSLYLYIIFIAFFQYLDIVII